jgi:superoxide dismutase
LDHDNGALEPRISGQINELHHGKHHATYVAGATDALDKPAEAREKGDHSAVFRNEKNWGDVSNRLASRWPAPTPDRRVTRHRPSIA